MADRPVSRGEVISLIAGIPLAVAATAGAASADVTKPTPAEAAAAQLKAQFGYMAKSTFPAKCSGCKFFTPSVIHGSGTMGVAESALGACKLIPGGVSAAGWCSQWKAAAG
jgi:hypothetical protein